MNDLPETGLKLVATNDVHYTRKTDAEAHDVLSSRPARRSMIRNGTVSALRIYLKSPDGMGYLFGQFTEALSNTLEVAERDPFIDGRSKLPDPGIPG